MLEILDKAIDFVIRYLLPYKMRLRLFAMEVFRMAEAMPPAIYMHRVDVEGFTMQLDLLREYYRLERNGAA